MLDEKAYAVMQKGSALLYTGSLVHGGGANRSDDTRAGMYIGNIPNWLRPLENSQVTVMNHLSPEAKELLGYSPVGFTVVF